VVLKVRDWWGGWILKRCLKVSPLQGGLDLKGGVELSDPIIPIIPVVPCLQ
jgi:hypothetical protein